MSVVESEEDDGYEELRKKYFFRIPYAFYLADYIWPGVMISPERLLQLKDTHFDENDVIVASYPKSGTTWVSEIVSAILHGVDLDALGKERLDERVPWFELDIDFIWAKFFFLWKWLFEGKAIRPQKHSPAVFFSHLAVELLPRDAIEGRCKVIYVVRNPKDNVVSYYHFHRMARFLGQQQRTTWNEFLTLFLNGDLYCGSWFDHVLSYEKLARTLNDTFLIVRYESLKNNFDFEINRICEFLKRPLTETQKEKLKKHCSFESMKSNKMTNRSGVWMFNQKVSNFFRKGVVGDWRNYFTIAQSDAFDRLFEEKMKNSSMKFSF